MSAVHGFRVAFDFWGARCDVEVTHRSDAEHLSMYFAEHGGDARRADVSIRLKASGHPFIGSLLNANITKEIDVRIGTGNWEKWDRFTDRSNRPSPLPPITLPPLQGTVSALHAAAVAPLGGDATLLVGPSFSGKSVLTLALMLRGWDCLTDDLSVLTNNGAVVQPFRRPIGIRENTLRILPELRPRLAKSNHVVVQLKSGRIWMVRPESLVPAAAPAPRNVGRVVFLQPQGRGQPLRLHRLSPSEALRRLAASVRTPALVHEVAGTSGAWALAFHLESQAALAADKLMQEAS